LVLGSAHGAAPDAAATDAGAWVMGGTKSSPSGTIQPMQAPTGSTSPSDAAMNFRTPEAGASTSIAALSVSISNSVAPLTTCAPSGACHRPIRPEFMSMSTRGMTISTAIFRPRSAPDAAPPRQYRPFAERRPSPGPGYRQ